MKTKTENLREKRSIFRSLFVPLFLIMILQAGIFYFAAVYGGIEETLDQNAADILSERLYSRKNEIETRFNSRWTDLDACILALGDRYADYETAYSSLPLLQSAQRQIDFLHDSAALLIDTLRQNEVNGVFLILNDRAELHTTAQGASQQYYGLCIRDMDQDSNYSGTEDLLLERAPSSIVDALDCSLDSWWEAKYTFASQAQGDYFYKPLNAAWAHPGAKGADLAYCSGVHQLSGSDPEMVSYSIPLIAADGTPYGVLGIELSTRYLATLLPSRELNGDDLGCYVLAMQRANATDYTPIIGSGALYTRCFGAGSVISCADTTATGGFSVTGRGDTALYGDSAALHIYNNNNPFESRQLTLLALVEEQAVFGYIDRIKLTLLLVSLGSLLLGIAGLALVSRRFAAPITALANRVRGMKTQSDFQLGRLGIAEIDQLVDSIEELNRNVSRNSARTEFFSRMSHDMRTPMNAIISFSSPEMLENATESAKNDYLQKIHVSGEYLLALINEVLDMTKIESNKTDLRLKRIRAAQLCDTTTPIIEKLAQKKGLTFSVQVTAADDLYVMADEQHLNQIIMNLLSNAVKFTPAGGRVQLEAVLTPDAEDSKIIRCRMVVSDTGIGMSEEFMKGMYTPFEQENSAQEGTGLGLSIAKKLVELMDGAIDCVSQKNVGTTFTVTLPLLRTDAVQNTDEAALPPESVDLGVLRGKRILVCEDNAINTQIISRLLEKVELIVEAAADGQAGVAAFEASPIGGFDAILMDIRMPVMDGLEATQRIRALPRPDAATVPILAMTANAFEEDMRDSMAAGMNAHLSKPVETKKLYAALAQFISAREG